jgi:heme/copper-type cytochrome/quinol oxidase subunit 2
MNFKTFSRSIVIITIVTLLICIAAFIVVLAYGSGTGLDFQGASGVAAILPAFAAVIIAAIALYSYMKLEDTTYKRSVNVIERRNKLKSEVEILVTINQFFINDMSGQFENNKMLLIYAMGLKLMVKNKLASILNLLDDLSTYFEVSSSREDFHKHLNDYKESFLLYHLIDQEELKTESISEMVAKVYALSSYLADIMTFIALDRGKFEKSDDVYKMLTTSSNHDYRNSRVHEIAKRHINALRQIPETQKKEL